MIDLFINLLASLIFVGLGYGLNYVVQKFKLRSFKKIWKPFVSEKSVDIYLSTRKGPNPWSTPRVSFIEVIAYNKCSLLLKKLGVETNLKKSNDYNLEEVKNNNIIVIGSPVANGVSKLVWENIINDHPFTFEMNDHPVTITEDDKEITINMNEYFFKFKTNSYKPELDEDLKFNERRWKSDYALILRYRNPLNKEKALFLLMGCHGFSTLGAMNFLLDKTYSSKILKATGNKDFALLIKFNLKNNEIMFTNDTPQIIQWHLFIKPNF